MKFLNLALIVIFFICSAESCFKGNKVDPQKTDALSFRNFSRNKSFNLDVSYNNDGNPILLKYTRNTEIGDPFQVKIVYEGEKIKTIIYERTSPKDGLHVYTHEVKYISENEVRIPLVSSYILTLFLTFNQMGLIEKSIKSYETDQGEVQYIDNYTYDSNYNLKRKETLIPDGSKDQFITYDFITYDDYDNMNNFFFAKAKIWSIIRSVIFIDFGTYMEMPISKNNARILTLRNYRAGNKLVYKYNENNLPTEIQEYVYKGISRPPAESDYWLKDETIRISY